MDVKLKVQVIKMIGDIMVNPDAIKNDLEVVDFRDGEINAMVTISVRGKLLEFVRTIKNGQGSTQTKEA